ncbi:MAG: GSCFA domain-containing protein [Bacteroidia bacterium]
MEFKLNFHVTALPAKINYSDKLLLMGSCFAENIAAELQRNKFNLISNPHGILYNPLNISASIEEYISKKLYSERDLFFGNERWNSFYHHSRFSDADQTNCLENINLSIENAHDQLKEARWLIITFGSAFIYKNKENQIVANCHKLPQKEFTKELVPVEEIINAFNEMISKLEIFNPGLNLIFTVSPVRYIRDGIIENNLSKAILLQAVHQLTKENPTCFYFPSYEIVNDELRDYRFFKEDLVHPNEMAIQYVLEKFVDSAFSDSAKELYQKIGEILIAKDHRPFNPESEAHKMFRKSYLGKVKKLQQQNSFLNFDDELNYFS